MPITIFTGLPGSGKSKRLIELVNDARSNGHSTVTVVSSDAAWIMGYSSYSVARKLASREPGGQSCPIDQFVSTPELEGVLAQIEPGTLVAIEEAQMFGVGAAKPWITASERGADLILVSPSPEQLTELAGTEYSEVTFAMRCQICHSAVASTVVIDDSDRTTSLCNGCFSAESTRAQSRIVELLVDELPHRGQRKLYQPVEIPECSNWPVSRPDSHARAEIVTSILKELRLIGQSTDGHPTYLDIGCSTGFFCNRFQQMGMYAKGVEASEQNIRIAKLLDSFVRRPSRPNKKFVTYVIADAYQYLRDTPQERFDVVSAFSVIQWIMTQRPLEEAIECFGWMFAKTKKMCVLEMGYSSQDQYGELLPVTVDREWVYDRMTERGGFEEIRVIDAATAGVMRDLFVGVKPESSWATE